MAAMVNKYCKTYGADLPKVVDNGYMSSIFGDEYQKMMCRNIYNVVNYSDSIINSTVLEWFHFYLSTLLLFIESYNLMDVTRIYMRRT